jgi:hypothetical protein
MSGSLIQIGLGKYCPVFLLLDESARHSTVASCYQIIFLKPNFTVRPFIVRPPQDTTALLGGEVSLECGVTGDPPPHVEWRRQDGAKIPLNRIRPASNDQTRTDLRLERLVASDAGRYVCEVENSVGSSSASAQLAILIPVCTHEYFIPPAEFMNVSPA